MSKKLFSDREIKSLLKNKYVKSISKRGITYTDEFKILFITEHINGKLPIHIFQDAGFDVQVIGKLGRTIKKIELQERQVKNSKLRA